MVIKNVCLVIGYQYWSSFFLKKWIIIIIINKRPMSFIKYLDNYDHITLFIVDFFFFNFCLTNFNLPREFPDCIPKSPFFKVLISSGYWNMVSPSVFQEKRSYFAIAQMRLYRLIFKCHFFDKIHPWYFIIFKLIFIFDLKFLLVQIHHLTSFFNILSNLNLYPSILIYRYVVSACYLAMTFLRVLNILTELHRV